MRGAVDASQAWTAASKRAWLAATAVSRDVHITVSLADAWKLFAGEHLHGAKSADGGAQQQPTAGDAADLADDGGGAALGVTLQRGEGGGGVLRRDDDEALALI